MVIIVKDNKAPVLTNTKVRIYQMENLVDTLVVYFSEVYNGHNVADFSSRLEYIDPGNRLHSEVLVVAEEQDKEGYIKYTLPITTELTKLAGKLRLYFSLVRVDPETMESQVFHTGDLEIEVLKWDAAVLYVPPEGLNAIDEKLLEVQAEIEKTKLMQNDYLTAQPNDLGVDVNDRLHLMHDKTVIGNGVEIVIPMQTDRFDNNPRDGIQDVDHLTDESEEVVNGSTYEFVDFDNVQDYDNTSSAPQNPAYQFLEL